MNPETLRAIYGCSASKAEAYAPALTETMAEFEINTPARQAMFLAQVGHESGRLQYVEELASGTAYTGRADLGNTKPDAYKWSGSTLPGPWFKGHGLIQITGYDNHQACGMALHPEDPEIFLREPKALCRLPDAARSAGWFWSIKNLNPLADAGDFRTVTRRINGGFNGMDDRLLLLSKAKAALA